MCDDDNNERYATSCDISTYTVHTLLLCVTYSTFLVVVCYLQYIPCCCVLLTVHSLLLCVTYSTFLVVVCYLQYIPCCCVLLTVHSLLLCVTYSAYLVAVCYLQCEGKRAPPKFQSVPEKVLLL